MDKRLLTTFEEVIDYENLCAAWEEFIPGKRQKPDVQAFAYHLGDELVSLYQELMDGSYQHGSYSAFTIYDPKQRRIHKASVRDRLLHRAVHRLLYPYFAKIFIADSYSCQNGKGTHKAMQSFREMFWKVSQNHTRTGWVLKCDIKKFFANINHAILVGLLGAHIADSRLMALIENIIASFEATPGKGIPLGNLTSQLFSNIYMQAFDDFVKVGLRVKHYIRYADDFAFLSENREHLLGLLNPIRQFLVGRLKLELHPSKVSLSTVASGVDFLGWVHFPHHWTLRTQTKRRMLKNIKRSPQNSILQSYLGLIKHGNAHNLSIEVENSYWLYGQLGTAELEGADE